MKKVILCLLWSVILFGSISLADDFEIVPKATDLDQVKNSVDTVGSDWWSVWKNYNEQAQKMNSMSKVWDQIASGIMTWDTLIYYVVYLIRFISQVGLLIWWIMIIYAWYLYATTVFGWDANKWKSAIKNAIIWVLITAFSYAIMKFLTAAFLT